MLFWDRNQLPRCKSLLLDVNRLTIVSEGGFAETPQHHHPPKKEKDVNVNVTMTIDTLTNWYLVMD